MDAERLDDLEASPAEFAWHEWVMSQDVDTGGRCTCGHEGLGIDWHLSACMGAGHALRRKVMELLVRLAEMEVESERVWSLVDTMLRGDSVAAGYMSEQRLRAELAARDAAPVTNE